jgi:hypothetical protein
LTAKEKFVIYCKTQENIPLFFQPDWLDAVSSGKWDILISEDNEGRIIAFMPVFFKNKIGFSAIYIPLLTPFSGIWITQHFPGEKNAAIQSNKRQIIRDLVDKIPETDYFRINFHHSFDMWLPFYNKKFKQTTHYTYLLKDIKLKEKIWDGFKSSLKNKIKKAEKEYTVTHSDNIALLFDLQKANFDKQKIKMPFDISYLISIDKANTEHRKIFIVKDRNQNIVAAQYLVWDKTTAYNLLLAIDEKHKNMGVGPLVLWHSIQYASDFVDVYDFEGSMLPGVQSFFESFGGTPIPYYQIYRIRHPWMRMWYALTGKI